MGLKGFFMLLGNAFADYRQNFKLSLAFGILLIFVFFFLFFSNLFIGSGTIFLEYSLLRMNPLALIVSIIAVIVFLLFYSIFVSFAIYNVRRELTKLREEHYLKEKLHKFSFKLFVFFLLFVILLFVLASLLLFAGVPVIAVNVLLLIVSVLFLFVPQSIVIDEAPLWICIQNNLEFMAKNKGAVLGIIVLSIILVAILPLIEFAFDFFWFSGRFVALIVALIFYIPFIEMLKARVYLTKFELVKISA